MASIITATTTSGLTQSADNSGVLQLASGTGNLVTVPSVTGTAMVSGNMPAFSAYMSANQSLTNGVYTKLNFDTESWDTNSCYDTTNKRFLPNVAGYYQFNITVALNPTPSSEVLMVLYKNGSIFQSLSYTIGSYQIYRLSNSCMGYANGTTDYFEVYFYQTNGASTGSGNTSTAFSGFLARTA